MQAETSTADVQLQNSVTVNALPVTSNALNGMLQNIVLTGDEIDYQRDPEQIIASGNLFIRYQKFTASANFIYYDIEDQSVWFPNYLTVFTKDKYLHFDDLYYSFSENKGEAKRVNAKINRLLIYGDNILIKPDEVVISNSSFTTCDLEHPHYSVLADKIYIYPKWGFLVAVNSTFHLGFLPFPLWVPTYIYGRSEYRSSTPIPDIGASPREGAYIKQKIGYFFNPSSTGTVDFGFAQNLGFLAGVNHFWKINNRNRVNMRYHFVGKDGWEGGIEYKSILLDREERISAEQTGLDSVFSLFTDTTDTILSEFKFSLQHRELFYDSRVSYLPLAGMAVYKLNLFDTGFYSNIEASYGKVKEETISDTVVKAWRVYFGGNIWQRWYLTPDLILDWNTEFFANRYHPGGWHRIFTTFQFEWEWVGFQPKIAYTKKLMHRGESPFEFEKKYARMNDELGVSVFQELGQSRIGISLDYDFERQKARNLDFIGELDFHCWRGRLTWKSAQQELQVGVDLF
ncbi:hypothetical protein ACFL96_03395 [Thermoproteota archaeon]